MGRHLSATFACGAVALAAGLTGGCSTTNTDLGADGKLVVAVAFYPIEDIVRAVGGDQVHIITVVPPGEDAHEYEPTPKQVTRLEQADVMFYLGGGFQPSVEQALGVLPNHVTIIDLTAPLRHLQLGEGNDPHVWMDPANMQRMAQQVLAVLAEQDSVRVDTFNRRASAYIESLDGLDHEFRAGLARCTTTALVTGHEAFGYLAHAYGLTQVPISGISPGAEPSAKALEQVATSVREDHVRTVFFEQNLPPDLARTVADETGAATSALNTLETLSRDELSAGLDYVRAMRANLSALRAGLGCA
ncbi:MAG: zinc ABC transporter substrate-binding protein [Actinobacteria bacterium]|uniref:Unannotated protein n=1 Tax=freshwater metagenome TaxID=449393 RepID=A0A6J6A5R6_9ZZZZ|nr:zinc ABC transporter substrate-binding protein [Actinomycetota bacterium]MSW77172.1 zinc ABC transporter substrate-binding protein [Actinomycetota bacterium]MSX55205.1 zinc ABC transporter substrate-binding protein [Actinomycetota bacterium]MSX92404.1 zinc ABC transporter substrate-binding protein [Actinomycetota bacterium]MSZ82960.1 zinc ABC transporter substrate-binding protein [Actinomycetota bacterium]